MAHQDPFPFLGTADTGDGLDRWLIVSWEESLEPDASHPNAAEAGSRPVDLYLTVRLRHPRTGEIRTLEFQRFLPSTRGLGG